MSRSKTKTKQFGTTVLNGTEYYRTRINGADGKRIALYAKTISELCDKIEETKEQIRSIAKNGF